MNIPIKVLKSNTIPTEKVRNQQKLVKKYYESMNSQKNKGSTDTKNFNFSSTLKNIHNIFSITNLKEEIIRWFFSFELNNKFIISSIENKWLVYCLHYMYIISKNDQNLKFSYLDGDAPENGIENYCYKTNNNKQPVIFTNKKMTVNLFFHYFSSFDDSKNFTTNKDFSEFNFLNEILFYKTEDSNISNDYCSYMTLSENLLGNEVKFIKLFDYFTNNRAFMNFIPVNYDPQSKYYTFGMPEWFEKKQPYSLHEIFLAFFEQTITVKFVLFHLEPTNYNFYYNKYIKNSYIKQLKEEKNSDKDNPIKFLEKIEGTKLNNLKTFNNINSPLCNESITNYNTFHDYSLLNNNDSFNLYIYQVKSEEKNLLDFTNVFSNTSQLINPTQNKKFNFIKSLHTCRINLEKEKNYPKNISDISEFDCFLKNLLREKFQVMAMYNEEIKTMDNLYTKLKSEKIIDEIIENKEMKEFLKSKAYNPQDFISFNRHSKLLKKVSFSDTETKSERPFDIDLKFFLTENQNIEKLLNNIIYFDINQIFTFDDIILKRIFDNIYSIYTYKNVLDLLAEEDYDVNESSDKVGKYSNNITISNNGGNNKKKKKKKNVKKNDEKNQENSLENNRDLMDDNKKRNDNRNLPEKITSIEKINNKKISIEKDKKNKVVGIYTKCTILDKEENISFLKKNPENNNLLSIRNFFN